MFCVREGLLNTTAWRSIITWICLCFLANVVCEQRQHSCSWQLYFETYHEHKNYRARCQKGYRFDTTVNGCVDINECVMFPDMCRGGGQCINTDGSYRCTCPRGYTLDKDNVCVDLRQQTCYLQYYRGRCSEPQVGLFKRSMCCCSVVQHGETTVNSACLKTQWNTRSYVAQCLT